LHPEAFTGRLQTKGLSARKGALRERHHDSTRGHEVFEQVPKAPAELRLHQLQQGGSGSGHQRGVQDHRSVPGRRIGRGHHHGPPGRQGHAEAQARHDRQERRRRRQVVRAVADQHPGHALRERPDQEAHVHVERPGLVPDRQEAAQALRRHRRHGARQGHRAGDDGHGHHQRPHADDHRTEGRPLLRGDAPAEAGEARQLSLCAQARHQGR
jgi:hypothetical protein